MELNNILSLPKSTCLNSKEYAEVVAKIPVNPIATPELIDNLKKVPEGEKPLDLIFAIKFKESKNDRLYSVDAYKSIVTKILTSDVFIPACYGHQKKDNVSWEGRKIVGSVIGAFLDEKKGIVYYRIIPDASIENADVRRWIRNKQLNAISIWGFADSEINAEGVEVVKDFSLLSIDFVPPLSEGQENMSLVIGENYNRLNNRIISNPKKNKEANMPVELFKIEDATNDALQGEMTRRVKDGRVSLAKLADETGFHVLTDDEVKASEEEKSELKKDFSTLLEKAKKLGFKSVDELFDFASDTLKKFEEEKLQGEFKSLKEDVMTEKGLLKDGKLKGRVAILVDKYAPIKQGMTREEISAAIEKMLKDNDITSFMEKEGASGEAINLHGEMLKNRNGNITVFEI